MPFLLTLLILLTSCSHGEHNDAHFEKAPNVRISEKRALYCSLSRDRFIAQRWAVDKCDGLIFSALRNIACGPDIPIETYEDSVEPGKWYRDPDHNCFSTTLGDQGSDSTISKDQLLGLIAYAISTKSESSKNILGRTIDYGKSRDWIIGEAKDNVTLLSKCFVTPGLQSLLKDAFNFQGGSLTDVSSDDSLPGLSTGFRAHLDSISIMIRGKINGKISTLDLVTIKEQVKRQPNNALFQAIKARWDDGDMSKATELLLDTNHWPEKSLPTSFNHNSRYLYQRDETPEDWGPSTHYEVFDGTDLVFTAAIIEGIF